MRLTGDNRSFSQVVVFTVVVPSVIVFVHEVTFRLPLFMELAANGDMKYFYFPSLNVLIEYI